MYLQEEVTRDGAQEVVLRPAACIERTPRCMAGCIGISGPWHVAHEATQACSAEAGRACGVGGFGWVLVTTAGGECLGRDVQARAITGKDSRVGQFPLSPRRPTVPYTMHRARRRRRRRRVACVRGESGHTMLYRRAHKGVLVSSHSHSSPNSVALARRHDKHTQTKARYSARRQPTPLYRVSRASVNNPRHSLLSSSTSPLCTSPLIPIPPPPRLTAQSIPYDCSRHHEYGPTTSPCVPRGRVLIEPPRPALARACRSSSECLDAEHHPLSPPATHPWLDNDHHWSRPGLQGLGDCYCTDLGSAGTPPARRQCSSAHRTRLATREPPVLYACCIAQRQSSCVGSDTGTSSWTRAPRYSFRWLLPRLAHGRLWGRVAAPSSA